MEKAKEIKAKKGNIETKPRRKYPIVLLVMLSHSSLKPFNNFK